MDLDVAHDGADREAGRRIASQLRRNSHQRRPGATPASIAASAADEYQDLRSPHAVDAARDLPPVQIPTPVVEVRGTPSAASTGATRASARRGMFALLGITAGSALLLTGRKRGQSVQVAMH
jgi:hypothetical protein